MSLNNDAILETSCSIQGMKNGKTCVSGDVAKIIQEIDPSFDPETMGQTTQELNTLLNNVDELKKRLGEKEFLSQLDNFKAIGPANSTDYFNNFVIYRAYSLLNQHDPTFYPVNVQLIDFYESNQSYDTSLRDMVEDGSLINKIRTGQVKSVGVILNTLTSQNYTKKDIVGHWVAIFMDFRNRDPKLGSYTIEYFNSSGNPAPTNLFNWMKKLASKIQSETDVKTIALNVSNVVHQKGHTECGPYSVFYIYSRVCGTHYKKFREKEIPDKIMHRFRQRILIPESEIKNKKVLDELSYI